MATQSTPFEIVIRGTGDGAALEDKVVGILDSLDGFEGEYRDLGGPNPQVRRLGGRRKDVPSQADLKANKHGEGYAAAAPPVLEIVGLERSPQSNGPLSPAPSTMAANDGVEGTSTRRSADETDDTGEEPKGMTPREDEGDGEEEEDATEAAASFAEENEIDLADVKGTGKDGRITKADVQKAIDARDGGE
jgi:pyruvate/2-oxoglutarate dehydrogenase complex dihydrolipoamide acyltransferase (E2) component